MLWKHQFPITKYLFSRNSYACPIWIFIFDTEQLKINIAAAFLHEKQTNLRLKFTRVDIVQKSTNTVTSQRRPSTNLPSLNLWFRPTYVAQSAACTHRYLDSI
jgi:hypothetical protein